MAVPFAFTGALSVPPSPTGAAAPIAANQSGQYDSRAEHDLQLTGSATHTVGLGTVGSPGAKFVLVQVISGAVMVRQNGAGSAGQTELTAGGMMLVGNPVPTAGITQVDLVHTADAHVLIWAFK